MATLVLAFDARLDSPLPAPARLLAPLRHVAARGGERRAGWYSEAEDRSDDEQTATSPGQMAPLQVVARALGSAPLAALEAAAAEAVERGSMAIVLFGDTLDPRRASPAQAADLRQLILSLGAQGCKTVCVLDEGREASELVRALGAPDHLLIATPAAPASLTRGGLSIDIASDGHDGVAVFESSAGAPATRWQIVGTRADDARTPEARIGPVRVLPPLQPRGHDEPAGACGLMRLGPAEPDGREPGEGGGSVRSGQLVRGGGADWLFPTQQVAWRTLSLEAPRDDDAEALASVIVSAIESLPPLPALAGRSPGESATILRVRVRCGSVAGRMRLADLSADVTGRVRSLYCPRSFPFWCEAVDPDPEEPLDAVWRTSRGGRAPGGFAEGPAANASPGVEMFAAELVAVACGLSRAAGEPRDTAVEGRRHPGPTVRREAAWLALELLEVA